MMEFGIMYHDGKCHLLWFVCSQSADKAGHGSKLSRGKEGAVIDSVNSH